MIKHTETICRVLPVFHFFTPWDGFKTNKCIDLTFFISVEQLNIEHFEKDDDSNGHIDFITATSVSFVWLP